MEYLLIVPVLVLLAISPWLIKPRYRVVETAHVGHVIEKLIFGFWFTVGNLSDRKNSLEIKLDKLTKEVSKTKKMLEDEEKALKSKVAVLNKDYQSHLLDTAGMRRWMYLWRKCTHPAFAFVKELAKKEKGKPQKRVTYFTLENLGLDPDFVLDKDAGHVVKHYQFQDNSRNQQQNQSNNQRKKGNNQQQNNQQNNQ